MTRRPAGRHSAGEPSRGLILVVRRRVVGCVGALIVMFALVVPVTATAEDPSPTPSTGGSGGLGLRLIDVPAATRDDPRAALYIVDHLDLGAVIHRRVQISNTSEGPLQVSLYPSAASIRQGVFVGAEGRAANELSTWTTVKPESLRVSPGATAVATVTIAVPNDAAPGENYAAVWAEARSPVSARGVTEVNRVGLRLYISVGPGGAPAPEFSIDSLTTERSPEGLPVVLASVRNSGGRALDMSGSLSLLAGPGGLNAGPYPATLGTTLAVGNTEAVRITLDSRIPAGPWSAQITLRSGLLERTAQATLTFPDSGSAAPVATRRATPWLLYGAISFVTATGVAAAAVVRRRWKGSTWTPGARRRAARAVGGRRP